jgi:hypothetical protein
VSKRKEETDLSKSIKTALEAMGFYVLRVNSGRVAVKRGWLWLAPAGTADLFAFKAGRVVALEVKVPGEVLDDAQVEWRDAWVAKGFSAACVHSIDEALAVVR